MKVSLSWLKDYVSIQDSAETLANRLTMAGLEVKKIDRVSDDTILETEITTNRPDWLSHLGVAREIHAITGNRFSNPSAKLKPVPKSEKSFNISIPDPNLCPYYSAVLLEEIEWAPSPDFMKKRLEACGIRSINLIVDITNYVLLEWGQPLHAFDASRLKGTEISARRARPSEQITAIDGTIYELAKNDLVIADTNGPVAIGGVMGGKDSEVNQRTKNVLLESAFFTPATIRATARRLGLSSESSYRFERRVDPRGVNQARERAVYLMVQYARPKRISRVFSAGKLPVREPKIKLLASELNQILGINIPPAKTKSYLTRLGLCVSGSGKAMTAQVPSFRSDLTQPVDLMEEVARLYGYHRIPETLPLMSPLEPRIDPILDLEDRVRDLSISFGFQEAISFSLVEPAPFKELGLYRDQWVSLVNPKNKELNLMRPSLLSGLMQAVRRNLYAGETDVRLFEVGNRYIREKGNPKEEQMVALAISGEGRLNWIGKRRPAGFYDLKGAVEELINRLELSLIATQPDGQPLFEQGEGIALMVDGESVGVYGTISNRARKIYDIDKSVYYAELNLTKLAAKMKKSKVMKEIPKFPSSPRDLTLIVREDLKAESVIQKINQLGKGLTSKIEVFDYFKGGQIPKGKKSLSFRIFYQSKERTLQNEEVNKLHFSIIDALNKSFGAELPKAKE